MPHLNEMEQKIVKLKQRIKGLTWFAGLPCRERKNLPAHVQASDMASDKKRVGPTILTVNHAFTFGSASLLSA